MDWQPIETAPPTDRTVLVYYRLLGTAFVETAEFDGETWWDGSGLRVVPTHWMPLPEPPH